MLRPCSLQEAVNSDMIFHLTHRDLNKNGCPSQTTDSVAFSWKRMTYHWMMTSSNGHFSALLALCAEGIHRSAVNSLHKGQWRGALMFLFYLRLNKRLSKQSRRHRAHHDVTVMGTGNGLVLKTTCLLSIRNHFTVPATTLNWSVSKYALNTAQTWSTALWVRYIED